MGAGLGIDDDDNIPLRIMLLLMDEVFDLRNKNTWLRRRIVAILRQIIKATFGDMINRLDYIRSILSYIARKAETNFKLILDLCAIKIVEKVFLFVRNYMYRSNSCV